ncbi:alternative ribosome rescue aminoacyl-tRNA hydrolase ArfB [Solimonas variicoloris]|uniref:alternative ribosome rescue aminoacyl-tRNA hydrolase ArfB n=1 Tax=Solimonas variicoloris TaxID=254408 RepID=UPI000369CBD8|nr:alternative ribosome rescue aminoacyl-tRNA hydrolase ArfB [Solimonas variicoloris]
MLTITPTLAVPLAEIEFAAMRSQGAGGQHVNKTESAVQLRFDVRASSLPEAVKERLLARRDRRLTEDGVVVIKAQQFRRQDQNRAAALERLRELLAAAAVVPRVRRATKPSRAAKRQRTDDKTRRGRVKALRTRVED